MHIKPSRTLSLIAVTLVFFAAAFSQTTTFSYKGRLSEAGVPANGSYDLEFKVFDASAGGTLLSTVDQLAAGVTNGDYTVSLDFGSGIFTGPARYMEISYRLSGTGNPYTILSPRDNVTTPYALNATNAATAINATQLGGVSSSQFVQTTDTRLSDARVPLPGNAAYIQNSAAQQAGSNFNISGIGTANIFSAGSQFNIGSDRVLSVSGTHNVFLGVLTGSANTGVENTFVGSFAGPANTTGQLNTFIGSSAGTFSSTGGLNTFVGASSGPANTSGWFNSYFGANAGEFANGSNNAFFGTGSGDSNTTGNANTFLGMGSGHINTTGSQNTLVGSAANLGSANLTNATAIGNQAVVSQSNSVVLGNNANVGIGISAPTSKLQVIDASNTGLRVQTNATGGTVASFGGNGAFNIDASGIGGGRFQVAENGSVTVGHSAGLGGNVGSLTVFGDSQLNTITAANGIKDNVLGTGGTTTLCRNASNQISFCSSSSRYKENIREFSKGLSFITQLRPITFNWKQGGMKDVGFGAEDVAKVDPLFVTNDDNGQVEGVKYDRISTALVNAVKELQAEIETLKQQVAAQRARIRSLKRRSSLRIH